MAKGRTNQPLLIWVAPAYAGHEKIETLREQGHRVVVMETDETAATFFGIGKLWSVGEPDLILHPAAHFWNDMMWDFLPAALTAARKRKREAGR